MKYPITALALMASLQFGFAQDLAEISGTVIDSSAKQPLSGARVVLYRLGSEPFDGEKIEKAKPAVDQDPESQVLAVLTGDNGQFSFKVAPGHVSIHARSAGYVPWGDDLKTGKVLALKASQKVGGVVIAMEMPVSISGRVIDPETEKPVPGLYVMAMARTVMDGSQVLMPAAMNGSITGKNGVYELRGVGPGDYILEAAPAHGERFEPGGTEEEFRSGAQSAYLRSYYPGVERSEQAETVTLLPGAALDRMDFKLAKRKAAAIRGCISSSGDSNRLGDFSLGLMLIEIQGSATAYRSIADKTVGAGACFKIEGLSPGKYYLGAWSKSTDHAQRAFVTLDLDDQRVDNVELNLAKSIEINGNVRLDENVTGITLKGMQVTIVIVPRGRMVFQDEAGESTKSKVSEVTGGFLLRNAFPGVYQVYVSGLPKGLALGKVVYNGALASRDSFAVNTGALDQRLELVICPAAASVGVSVEGGRNRPVHRWCCGLRLTTNSILNRGAKRPRPIPRGGQSLPASSLESIVYSRSLLPWRGAQRPLLCST